MAAVVDACSLRTVTDIAIEASLQQHAALRRLTRSVASINAVDRTLAFAASPDLLACLAYIDRAQRLSAPPAVCVVSASEFMAASTTTVADFRPSLTPELLATDPSTCRCIAASTFTLTLLSLDDAPTGDGARTLRLQIRFDAARAPQPLVQAFIAELTQLLSAPQRLATMRSALQ